MRSSNHCCATAANQQLSSHPATDDRFHLLRCWDVPLFCFSSPSDFWLAYCPSSSVTLTSKVQHHCKQQSPGTTASSKVQTPPRAAKSRHHREQQSPSTTASSKVQASDSTPSRPCPCDVLLSGLPVAPTGPVALSQESHHEEGVKLGPPRGSRSPTTVWSYLLLNHTAIYPKVVIQNTSVCNNQSPLWDSTSITHTFIHN